MGLLDKVKETASQAKDAATKFADEKGISGGSGSIKEAFSNAATSIKADHAEAKAMRQPLEGAIIRYEFTYVGGLPDIPKRKVGAWGMNVMRDRFAFRVTNTTKDWLYDLDIPYDDITNIYIDKRDISTTEMLLGGGNDPNQQQENVVVIEYNDQSNQKATLRVEMLTGTTIYTQAAKCKEFMDILRREDILDKLKKNEQNSGGGDDIIAQIEKLSKLKDSGILSEEEFATKKTELLAKL